MRSWARAAIASGLLAASVIVSTQIARSQEPGDSEATAAVAVAVEAGIRERGVLHNARVGVCIVDVVTGEEIYTRDPDGAYNVASNVKLVTAAAALSILGPDYRYRTAVYGDALDQPGVVKGNLYLVGRGDPSFDTVDLRRLARKLRRRGITRVTGSLVLDDTYFDDQVMPPHFDEQPDEDASFRAAVSALSLNFNAVALVVRPGAGSGDPAVVTTDPPNAYVSIDSEVTTTRTGRTRLHATSTEHPDRLEVRVVGRINLDAAPRRLRKRAPDPHLFVGGAWRQLLAEHGIRVGRKRLRRGSPPPEAIRLATTTSPPVGTLVRGLGKWSNNYVAEMLLKTMGAELRNDPDPAPTTWADGQAAVRGFLTRDVGLAEGSFRLDNGSGLFDSNELTPRQITRVLQTAYRDFRYGPEYVASLALGGADGTLRNRLEDGPGERQVRAKTGTLANVSALSGYVAIDGTNPLAFSVIVNDIPDTAAARRSARSLQDDVAEALVVYLRAVAAN